jgi:hydrogenase maturation protein HypF
MRFHRMLAEAIVAVAGEIGVSTVALTGGCFQNTILLVLASDALRAGGFNVLCHRGLSPNDNSIAAGQALGASWGITTVETSGEPSPPEMLCRTT